MSPLTRSLFALACAALLHASSADILGRLRAERPDAPRIPIGQNSMGTPDPDDKNLRAYNLQPFIAASENSSHIIINIPNKAHKNEALVGQEVAAVDMTSSAKVSLSPVKEGHHSPLKAHCKPSCPRGLLIFADQYAIKTLK